VEYDAAEFRKLADELKNYQYQPGLSAALLSAIDEAEDLRAKMKDAYDMTSPTYVGHKELVWGPCCPLSSPCEVHRG
jgi:hypothetical protein